MSVKDWKFIRHISQSVSTEWVGKNAIEAENLPSRTVQQSWPPWLIYCCNQWTFFRFRGSYVRIFNGGTLSPKDSNSNTILNSRYFTAFNWMPRMCIIKMFENISWIYIYIYITCAAFKYKTSFIKLTPFRESLYNLLSIQSSRVAELLKNFETFF